MNVFLKSAYEDFVPMLTTEGRLSTREFTLREHMYRYHIHNTCRYDRLLHEQLYSCMYRYYE